MANVKKCDRCGKLYVKHNESNDAKNIDALIMVNSYETRGYYVHGVFKICPECKESFEKWKRSKTSDEQIKKELQGFRDFTMLRFMKKD